MLRSVKDVALKVQHWYLREKNDCILDSTSHVSLRASVSNVTMGPMARIATGAHVQHSVIGRLTSIGRDCKVTRCKIGSFCAISWDITINAIMHPVDYVTISAFPYAPYLGGFAEKSTRNYDMVKIGHDVWIGANAVIMPGVTVGHGAIIGASAVVSHDVNPYEVVAGVPARTIRYRFEDETIERLLNLQWWYWPDDVLKENLHLFQKPLNEELLLELEKV